MVKNLNENGSRVLLTKIQSRHMNRIKYNVILEYIPGLNDSTGITGWACTCKIAKRTLGCCSHICSLIYYLSYLKFGNFPAKKDFSEYIILDSSNDDSEDETQDLSLSSNKATKLLNFPVNKNAKSSLISENSLVTSEVFHRFKTRYLSQKLIKFIRK